MQVTSKDFLDYPGKRQVRESTQRIGSGQYINTKLYKRLIIIHKLVDENDRLVKRMRMVEILVKESDGGNWYKETTKMVEEMEAEIEKIKKRSTAT